MPSQLVIDTPPPTANRLLLRRQLKYLAAFTAALILCFASPLGRLLQFTFHNELFSYVPLIPLISIYLAWIKKDLLAGREMIQRGWAALPVLAAAGALWASRNHDLNADSKLYLAVLAFVLLFWAGCLALLPKKTLRELFFPLAFLIFVVPLPLTIVNQIDGFFQQTSTLAAAGFISSVGTPVFKENLTLHLSNISLIVAPECSGIHSTSVLLITSLLAGYLFLPSWWKRLLLVFFIIPLAIARNGFRIFVIGELCVHYGPQMIDAYIHRKGGPIFFVLSLIPFFLFLVFLRRIGSNSDQATKQL